MAANELVDSYDEQAQIGNGTGTRKWICDWTERKTFAGHPVQGHSLFTTGLSALGVDPEGDRKICEGVHYEGKGAGTSSTVPFSSCVVTATYRERQGFAGNCLESYKGNVRILTLVDTAGINPVGKRFPMGTLVVPIYFLRNPSLRGTLDALTGKVNTATWTDIIGGGSYSAETVLFDCYDCDEFLDPTWGRMQKVTYNLSINYAGWNKVPVAVPTISYVLETKAVYSTASFTGLFTVGTRIP